MKKYILSLIAIALTLTSQAQEWSFGAKVGMNIATMGMHGEDIEGRKQYRSPVVGASAGLTAEYKFKKPISLSFEALFSQQGVKYKYDGQEEIDGTTCKVTHRYSYINVPILLNYYFVKELPLSFNIGIQPGYLIKQKQKIEISDGSSSTDYDGYSPVVWEGGYYNFDLAVPVGFTYTINNRITLDARYTIGVLNILDEPNDEDYDKDFGATNNTLTLSVGFKF